MVLAIRAHGMLLCTDFASLSRIFRLYPLSHWLMLARAPLPAICQAVPTGAAFPFYSFVRDRHTGVSGLAPM